MITVSVCMIVKNESKILRRCLDSYKPVWDELIIVDTGSEDDTIDIARTYTDKVYEFAWTGDFSEARNFAISKASCDYIFTADADEILEGENVESFLALKSCLDESVDVVQMYYGNQLDHGTVYNFDKELRPKLFKRVKPIRFKDPVHETLDLEVRVIDTDIVITHKPEGLHSGRDLDIFARLIKENREISPRLMRFLNRELYLLDDPEEFDRFAPFLENMFSQPGHSEDEMTEICILLARYHRIKGDYAKMYDYVTKAMAIGSTSEICTELGFYHLGKLDYDNAAIWFYNAAHETVPVLSIHSGTDIPLNALGDIYEALGNAELAAEYRAKAKKTVNIDPDKLTDEV